MPRRKDLPFVGCDGEGGGVDSAGRQNYLLFRMGNRVLENRDGSRLSSSRILEFICAAPPNFTYVGFGFNYDVTQILRDMPAARWGQLFLSDREKVERWGFAPQYVAYREFDVAYRAGQYLRVRRLYAEPNQSNPHRPIPNSTRTIYDVRGNFQGSFVTALSSYDVGTERERDAMQRVKDKRQAFKRITREIRRYNAVECEFLARLMERVREYSYAAPDGGIRPHTWNGAGKFGHALLEKHLTPRCLEQITNPPAKGKRPYAILHLPNGVTAHANAAYYGGRFEVCATGRIPGPVYEYDIHSAYPAQMRALPCLIHGKWHELKIGQQPSQPLYVCSVKYTHPESNLVCGLPHRDQLGRLQFRKQGWGTYWSLEIEAAKSLGLAVKEWCGGWEYEKQCDCVPFHWVEPYYHHRRRLEQIKKGMGQPVKLGLNAMYGKQAQRIGGGGPYTNFVWAGLISGGIRAKLVEAAAQNPAAVAMMATDAIYTTKKLKLPIGEALGKWELTRHDGGIFIVQPGLYWPLGQEAKVKTRGLPRQVFDMKRRRQFETAWDKFLRDEANPRRSHAAFPVVPVTIQNFIGLRLAYARGKPDLAGRWMEETRNLDFNYTGKRAGGDVRGGAVWTRPIRGSTDIPTVIHDANPTLKLLLDELEEIFEALPDFLNVRPF